MHHQTPVIPEIRVYSPSDNGDRDSSDLEPFRVKQNIREAVKVPGRLFEGNSQDEFTTSGITQRNILNGVCYFGFDPSSCVPWQGAFNMRPQNLQAASGFQRAGTLSMHKARSGYISSTSRSLELLREYVQPFVNVEIRKIMEKYIGDYFKPGLENIRMNSGENAVSDQHLQAVCRQILEHAKKIFITQASNRGDRSMSPNSDHESGRHSPLLGVDHHRLNLHARKSRISPNRSYLSDSESDASQLNTLFVPRKKNHKTKSSSCGSGRSTPASRSSCKSTEVVKREGSRWDPARMTTETKFVMGAKANKALGLGAQRGRLYIKHQDVFRYCGDTEDKLWLYEHNLMPSAGGRAFLLLLDDIKHLARTEEYRNAIGVEVENLSSFQVPQFMINKMRSTMLSQRTDIAAGGGKKRKNKSPAPSERSHASSNNLGESRLSPCPSSMTVEEEPIGEDEVLIEEELPTEEYLPQEEKLSIEEECPPDETPGNRLLALSFSSTQNYNSKKKRSKSNGSRSRSRNAKLLRRKHKNAKHIHSDVRLNRSEEERVGSRQYIQIDEGDEIPRTTQCSMASRKIVIKGTEPSSYHPLDIREEPVEVEGVFYTVESET